MLHLVGVQPAADPVVPLVAPGVHRVVRIGAAADPIAAVVLRAQDQMRAAGHPGRVNAAKSRQGRLHVGADHALAPSPLTAISHAARSMKCRAAKR